MAGIIRGSDVKPVQTQWDPFEVMRGMLGWNPFQLMERGFAPMTGQVGLMPAFDIRETPDAFICKADLPGIQEEDIDISLTGNRLTISGTRQQEQRQEGETYYSVERSYGSFSRTFTVPEGCDLDNVKAELKDGVLTLVLPKQESVKPKRISLKGLKEGVKESVEGLKEKVSEKMKS